MNNNITNFQNWFKLNCHVHDYRTWSNYTDINALTQSNNLHILSARTSFYGLKLIKVYGPKYWNAIPSHIRSIVSLKYFSKVLKLNHMLLLLPFQFNKKFIITKSLQKCITSIIIIYYYYCYLLLS